MWKGFPLRPVFPLATLAIFLAVFSLVAPAFAQSADALNQHILRQQQQEQRSRELELQRGQFSGGALIPEGGAAPQNNAGACIEIRDIQISGTTRLSVADRAVLERLPEAACMDVAAINRRVNDIIQRYQTLGYITTRASVPPQDLQSGTLIIEVTEGRIERLSADNTQLHQREIASMFPVANKQLLNLRDLEQGLDNLNRLRSYRATLELRPGSQPGFSEIKIDTERSSPWYTDLRLNNHGQPSTGEHQAGLLLTRDSPFRAAGYAYAYLQTDVSQRGEAASSESAQLHYDIPLGYWAINIDLSDFRYSSQIDGVSSRLISSGDVRQYKVSLGRVLNRDAVSINRAGLAWRRRESRRYIEEVELDSGRQNLEALSFYLSRQQFGENHSWRVDLGVDQGVDLTGADYGEEAPDGPQSQFRKYWLDARTRIRGVLPFAASSEWQHTLYAQQSSELLYSSDQVSIGGRYSVRGFFSNSYSGTSGGYWRQLLSIRPDNKSGSWLPTQVGLGLDVGRVRDDFAGWRNLRGAGIELHYRWGNINLVLSYNRALGVPDAFRDNGETLLFSLQLAGS